MGLVDTVGTLNDAVKAAAKNAGLGDKYQVIVLPEAKSLSDVLRKGLCRMCGCRSRSAG